MNACGPGAKPTAQMSSVARATSPLIANCCAPRFGVGTPAQVFPLKGDAGPPPPGQKPYSATVQISLGDTAAMAIPDVKFDGGPGLGTSLQVRSQPGGAACPHLPIPGPKLPSQ